MISAREGATIAGLILPAGFADRASIPAQIQRPK